MKPTEPKTITITIDRFKTKRYWLNGKLHRTNGPAVEPIKGPGSWFLFGKHHRIDGPAYEHKNHRTKHWWINGIQLTKKEWSHQIKLLNKLKSLT
jgi:hypothetical protein